MNLLDWCLLLVAFAYALSGYWQGFITGAFATLGLVLGGLLGIWLAPKLLGDASPSVGISLAGSMRTAMVTGSSSTRRCANLHGVLGCAGTPRRGADHANAEQTPRQS